LTASIVALALFLTLSKAAFTPLVPCWITLICERSVTDCLRLSISEQ
jgi:hypothetical protein